LFIDLGDKTLKNQRMSSPQKKKRNLVPENDPRFSTPAKGTSNARPSTAVKGRNSISPFKPAKKGKVQPAHGLLALVKKKDRLKSAQVIQYFEAMIECADRLKDPLDEIEAIFGKI
jgi:hypothetical protein